VNDWPKLRYHPAHAQAINTTARWVDLIAGRRSGKTEIAERSLVMQLPKVYDHGMKGLYGFAGPTYKQTKRVAWEKLKTLIPREWVTKVSETELLIETHWSTLLVGGLDQPQRWEGVGYDRFVVDERCDVKPEAITTSILPALADRKGSLWQIGVPKRTGIGKDSFYDHFDKIKSGEIEDGLALEWKSSEVMDASELENLKTQMTEEDAAEQFDAMRLKIGGTVYYALSDANLKRCDYDPNREIIVGSDFNVTPMCWTLGHERHGPYGTEFHVFGIIWKKDTNTYETCDALAAAYGAHTGGWTFHGDASSRARKTSSIETDLAIIKNDKRFLNSQVMYPRKNPSIEARIKATNTMMRAGSKGNYRHRLFIDPDKCAKLVTDYKNRKRKEGKMELDDGPFQGHLADSCDYIMHARYPIMLEGMGGMAGIALM